MLKKLREYMAICRIRKNIKHLSPERQVQIIVHAFLQTEINEQVNKVLKEELDKYALEQSNEGEKE